MAAIRSKTVIIASPSRVPSERTRPMPAHRTRVLPPGDRPLASGTFTEAASHPKVVLLQDDTGETSYALAPPHARGAYGAISYAQDANQQRLIAKTLYTKRSREQSRQGCNITPYFTAVHEMSVARAVPKAVDSAGGFSTGDRFVHVMELMDGNWIQAQDAIEMQTHASPLGLEAFAQSARGLASFHSAGVLHGDIKLENLLWSRAGHIKWGDYGFSIRLNPAHRQTRGTRGSPFAMAPEIAERCGYGFAADMWSYGVALGEMFVGHKTSPFRLMRQPQERAYLAQESLVDMHGKLDIESLFSGFSPMHAFFQRWYHASPDTCRFGVEELFHYNPAMRATSERAVEVAEHLLATQPSHPYQAKSALGELALPDAERERTFAQLDGAWRCAAAAE